MPRQAITANSQGKKSFGDGESWMYWWHFNRVLSDDEIEQFLEQEYICYHYSGPGLHYSNAPNWRRSRSHTLISQFAGYDV